MRTRLFKSSGDPVEREQESHRSVLLLESIAALALRQDDIVVDATLGGAGHAREIARRLGKSGVLIGFDADAEALERAKEALKGVAPIVHLVHDNFRTMKRAVTQLGISRITKALFDLGWSSHQLNAGRGFSFLKDEPLSLAYDARQSLDAATIVNEWSEESLADILWGWGEERYARRIARGIVEARTHSPIRTSRELGELVRALVPPAYRRGKIHPATRTFQALRIAVNDELGALEEGIRGAWELMGAGGRIVVITFHSIEDRIVKHLFLHLSKDGAGALILKKALKPTEEEVRANPRSRSAKLRGIEKRLDT